MLLHLVFNHLDCRSIDVLVEGDLEVVPSLGYLTSSPCSSPAFRRIVVASVDIWPSFSASFPGLYPRRSVAISVVILSFSKLCLDCQAASDVSDSVAISQLARESHLNLKSGCSWCLKSEGTMSQSPRGGALSCDNISISCIITAIQSISLKPL